MLKRKIFKEIEKYIFKKEILILLWARQVGKTSIMRYFFNKIEEQKIWLNLDNFSNCDKFWTLDSIISFLKLENLDFSKKIFLFVDEFQYCKNSELILKNIYDEYENIKIIASWSSSMEIKNKIRESLAWRKKIFYVYSLDFEEFVSWKFILEWKENNLIDFKKFKTIDWKLEKIASKYYDYLEEYLVFWSYPKTLLENNKEEILDNIFDLYLKKDILDLLNIKNVFWFKKIVTYLAINNGKQINFSMLSNFSDVDINTTKSYIDILEETFIIKQVRPYFSNKNKEIVKSPKIYFLDNWVRNYFIKNFITDVDLRQDIWELFEWVILQEFIKNNIHDIKYWRTKSWVEVDFIIDYVSHIYAFELKYKNKIKSGDFAWLKSFWEKYDKILNKSLLISKDRDKWSITIFDRVFAYVKAYKD